MDWQPIETAPKDGTEILTCSFEVTQKPDGSSLIWYDCEVVHWVDYEERGGWWNGDVIRYPDSPTHWMPLPEPPKDAS